MRTDQTSTAKTVEKALRILETFQSSSWDLSITEIARLSRINTSTVQRIVNTLAGTGYLRQSRWA